MYGDEIRYNQEFWSDVYDDEMEEYIHYRQNLTEILESEGLEWTIREIVGILSPTSDDPLAFMVAELSKELSKMSGGSLCAS